MNATHALGWALVHFLWQGAALAILLGVALALGPPRLREAAAVLKVHEATASRRLTRIHGEIRKSVEGILMKQHGWTQSEAARSLSEIAAHLQMEIEPLLATQADPSLRSSPAES